MVNPESVLLTEAEAANVLGCSARTLRRWRHAGQVPPYVMLKGRPRYIRVLLDKWAQAEAVNGVIEQVTRKAEEDLEVQS